MKQRFDHQKIYQVLHSSRAAARVVLEVPPKQAPSIRIGDTALININAPTIGRKVNKVFLEAINRVAAVLHAGFHSIQCNVISDYITNVPTTVD